MEYRKTLIILSGDGGRCAATVETTAKGSECRLSVKASGGNRFFAVKDGEQVFVERLSRGAYLLPFTPSDDAHYMLIADGRAIMYGTRSKNRLICGNIMDGVRKYVSEKEREYAATDAHTKTKEFAATAENVQKIEYDDEAIALSDYYPKGYGEMKGLNKFYRSERGVDGGSFSAATRVFLARYNEQLCGAEEKAEKVGFFAMQRRYVYMSESSRDEKVAAHSAKRSARTSIKSYYPAKESKGQAQVVGLKMDFYDEIRAKMDRLFEKGERMSALELSMPGTKWVKIPYEKSGYYVVGIIGDKPDYIAYGLPGKYSGGSPEALGEGARWWPLSADNPSGSGLWLLYQDARTGESVSNP